MPRFYFHIFDEAIVGDDEGLMLSGADAVRAVALDGARAMICEQVKNGRLHLGHRIEVEDETGEQVLLLPFLEALDIENLGATSGT